MGIKASGIFYLVLALNVSAVFLSASGMDAQLGIQRDTDADTVREWDRSDETIRSDDSGTTDYLGFTVTGVTYFFDFLIVLGNLQRMALTAGFPGWFVEPMMWLVVRPIWYWGGIQLIRGVVIE